MPNIEDADFELSTRQAKPPQIKHRYKHYIVSSRVCSGQSFQRFSFKIELKRILQLNWVCASVDNVGDALWRPTGVPHASKSGRGLHMACNVAQGQGALAHIRTKLNHNGAQVASACFGGAAGLGAHDGIVLWLTHKCCCGIPGSRHGTHVYTGSMWLH